MIAIKPLRARGRFCDADGYQRDRDVGDAPGKIIETLALQNPGGNERQPLYTKGAQGQNAHGRPAG